MRNASRVLVGSTISLCAILFASVVFAQNDGSPVDTIQIEAGKMLEISTDTITTKPDFSWILTKDRKFLNAERTRFFQTRFAQTGNYILDVSVQDAQPAKNDYNAFHITVTEPGTEATPTSTTTTLKAVLKTIPASIQGTVYVSPNGGIVTIDGSSSTGKISSYFLDLDNGVDTDGNGDPTDDRDNQDTYSAQSGSPILYLMKNKSGARKITLTVTDATTGQTSRASVNVVFGQAPAGMGSQPQTDPGSPITIDQTNGIARFSAQMPDAETAGRELLYEWNFGDGGRSLLMTPVHTYAISGTYAVSLTVRDISNGQIVYQGSTSVQAEASPAAMGSQSSASSDSQGGDTKTPSGFWSTVKVGFIVIFLIALAIGLYMLFTWIKRKTTGTLVTTIENMEKTIVKSDKTTDGKPEPLKIKKDNPTTEVRTPVQGDLLDKEKSKTEFSGTKRDNAVPVAASGPVPSWLAKASTTPIASPAPTAPAPIPAPVIDATVSPAKVEPQKPSAAPKSPAAPVPDWLKEAPQKKEAKPSAPTAAAVTPIPASTAAKQEPKQPAPLAAAPKEQPKPQKPSVPAAPIPAPKTLQEPPKPKAITAPVVTEKKEVKVQAPAPAPQPPKKPTPAPVKPSPAQTATKPVPQDIPKDEKASSKPSAKPKTNGGDEPPIAIIKADSLMK